MMGPNGQAQYWAPDLAGAFASCSRTTITPTSRRRALPAPREDRDPVDRDVRDLPHPHPASDFTTFGDIFSDATNPERKKPFDMRTLMRAVVDQDHAPSNAGPGWPMPTPTVVFDDTSAGYPVA